MSRWVQCSFPFNDPTATVTPCGRMTATDVQAFRERFELNKAEFARLMGVELRTVYRWEKGTSKVGGTALAVMLGFREKLSRDPTQADAVVAFVVDVVRAGGGLAMLLVKLLDRKCGG